VRKVDLPRRWRWVAVVCCVALLMLAVWLVAGFETDEIDRNPAPRPVDRQTHEREAIALAPDAPPAQRNASVARGSDDLAACGGTMAAVPATDVDEVGEYRVVPAQSTRARVLEALQARPDDLSRATVLLMRMLGAGETDTRMQVFAALIAQPCAGNDCPSDAMLVESAAARDTLARLAMTTTDPKVYSMAWRACKPHASVGVCALVSAEQWARLDPDNGTPWLHLLAQANARGEPAAVEHALFRLSGAKRGDSGFLDAAGAIFAAAGDDPATTVGSLDLAAATIGFEGAVGLPSYQTLVNACKSPALADPNRQQTCNNIAEYLVNRSDSLLDRAIGISVGRQAGWSNDRLDRLKGEGEAYSASLNYSQEPVQAGCGFYRTMSERIRQNVRLGETGALRAFVVTSRQSPDDFMRAHREKVAAVENENAAGRESQAASGASSPAATGASAAAR
jgi:hypothetical protein